MTTMESIIKNNLDVQMDDLIEAYKAQGLAVVAVVIKQTPDGEGTVSYKGEVVTSDGMHINGIRYAGEALGRDYIERLARGETKTEVTE